jgi:hypothetical protein
MARMYNSGLALFAGPEIDWENADVRALMLDEAESYTFNATHEFVTSVATAEMAGTNYQRVTLAGKSTEVDAGNHLVRCLANPVLWENLDAGEAGAIVTFLYVENTEGSDDATSVLISYHDDGFPRMSNGEDFGVDWAGPSQNRVLRLVGFVPE